MTGSSSFLTKRIPRALQEGRGRPALTVHSASFLTLTVADNEATVRPFRGESPLVTMYIINNSSCADYSMFRRSYHGCIPATVKWFDVMSARLLFACSVPNRSTQVAQLVKTPRKFICHYTDA